MLSLLVLSSLFVVAMSNTSHLLLIRAHELNHDTSADTSQTG